MFNIIKERNVIKQQEICHHAQRLIQQQIDGMYNLNNIFQLLKRNTARKIFKTLHIERWAFDVEMLKLGRHDIAVEQSPWSGV